MGENNAKEIKVIKGSWQEVESSKDVLCNILSRLPAEDLVNFRTVSSHWRSVIRSPALVETQFARFSDKDQIYVVFPLVGPEMDVHLVDTDGTELESINIPGAGNLACFRMNCSGNGLICFTNYPYIPEKFDDSLDDVLSNEVDSKELDIRVFNPLTREILVLPRGTSSEKPVKIGMSFGPGFAEYKVYRFYTLKKPDPEPESEELVPYYEVFTPSSGEWRAMGRAPAVPCNCESVFVDGKTYWLLPDPEDPPYPESVLILDGDGKFSVIETPVELGIFVYLTELRGKLCLVAACHEDWSMRVWVLKYEKDEYDWEDLGGSRIPCAEHDLLEAVAGIEDEIFFVAGYRYFLYNLKSQKWKELDDLNKLDTNTPEVLPFTGSLVPCNGTLGPDF